MNKFTKLLSVFVIAGAVSAGVATLAGCGHTHEVEKHDAKAATCTEIGYSSDYYTCSAPECEGKYYSDEACKTEIDLATITIAATGHSATKHDAKAATCTEVGYSSAYYTCSGTECTGKYYSDEACTTEVTLANITVAATGHTEVYADKGDGTHGITCEKGDLTETTEAHTDADNNGKCDKCKALFFAPGKYYNANNASEFEILANSKIIYNDREYTLSAVTEDATTHALSATFTIAIGNQSQEYTLTKTATGYTISYQGGYGTVSKDYLPMPEIIAEDIETFAGVFEGTLTFGDSTVTRISITADGYILVTQAAVTTIKDATSAPVAYNTFSTEGWSFVAKAVEDNAVTTIEVTYNAVSATFTRTDEAIEEVPEALPVDEYTYYMTADNVEVSYKFVVNSSESYYRYTLNGMVVELISGNETDGYLVKTLNSNYDPVNYLLKVSADKASVELYEADKTTKIADLALTVQSFPEIKVDGTVNNNAVTDVFNSSYAYYKVAATGWYTFTAGSNDVCISTEVINHQVTNYGEAVLQIASGKSKTVYLKANSLIAVDDYYKTDAFTAAYSETEPVVVIEYASFTDGKYEIATFDGSETYYVKGTVETAGKYYVTVTSSERTESGKECLVYNVNGVEYGSYYDTSSWKFVVKEAGLTYSADLTTGTEVVVAVSTPNSGWDFGKVTVYFETEEEYNNRLNGGSTGGEETTDLFSADKIGTYVYEAGKNLTFKVEANQITMSGGQYGYGTYKPTITKSDDTYTLSYMGYKLVFSFNADGNIAVTSDTIYDYNSFVAVKQTSSETPTIPAGVVGNNTVSAGQTGNGSLVLNEAGTWTVTYVSGVSYVLAGTGLVVDGGTVIVTAGNPITLTVYVDVANATEAVINLALATSGSGETGTVNKVANGGNLALGANEVTTYDNYKATVYLTASETLPAGTYTLTIANLWSQSLSIDGAFTADDGKGNVTVEVTLGDTPVAIAFECGESNVTIKVATKA